MNDVGSKVVKNQKIDEVSVDLIDLPERELRSVIIREKLDELVESIRILGILQPLRLARKGDRYEVICGCRRLLAAKALGMPTVPCIVADSKGDTALVEAVHENIIREDVNPIDLGRWLREVKREKDLTNSEVSALFGKSHGWASQYLVLLKCDGGIQAAVAAGQIDVVSARRLQSVEDSNIRHSLLTHAVQGGASQATISGWVAREKIREKGDHAWGDGEESGEESEPPAELTFVCGWCGLDRPSEDMINVPFCSECFAAFKQAVKLEEKQEKKSSAAEEKSNKNTKGKEDETS